MKIYLFLIFIISLVNAKILDYDIRPKDLKSSKFMSINILDSKEYVEESGVKFPVNEISALAYDGKTLYALSDSGYLYHFKLKIIDSKIKELKLKKEYKLNSKISDAEGMSYYDGSLIISFERKPKIELYTLDAQKIRKIKINKALKKRKNYVGKNKMLESVTYSNKYGLITAPELPLKHKNLQILYTLNKKYKFRSSGNITAIEMIDGDSILVLLRDFNHITRQRSTILKRVHLDRCNKKMVCKSKTLAFMDSYEGWKIDNFEGLTKISNNLYLMVSDDNDSIFQKTLFVLFEIID